MIQIITDSGSSSAQYPISLFQNRKGRIKIENNSFGPEGIRLDIQTPELHAAGIVRFGPFARLKYDIMGPFHFVPFMQCRHNVFSMTHSVDGRLMINGVPYTFQNAVGYLEGDRGYSFPKEYLWTQCSFPEGALMLSVADIPLGGLHFTGIIGIVLLNGKEYRLATYLGAKATRYNDGSIVVRQGNLCLTVKQLNKPGHPLCAPVAGAMTRTIHEHPSCKVFYHFSVKGIVLLDMEAPNAAYEYEYPG